jgi:Domain of unknown function (DUF4372)
MLVVSAFDRAAAFAVLGLICQGLAAGRAPVLRHPERHVGFWRSGLWVGLAIGLPGTLVRTLGCAELFRVMAFAQLTWRESLRNIQACLGANQSKLFHMGLAYVPARSTLVDALNARDWRIYHALAMNLIPRARALYAQDALPSLDLDATVYALDAPAIDLCLSLFD